MPTYDYNARDKLIQDASPYSYQRQFVQHSNYPRPAQAGIQPNQLRKQGGIGMDYFANLLDDYEKETGIPTKGIQLPNEGIQPRKLNWRIL